MTATQLHDLAKDPQAFDIRLAGLHQQHDGIMARIGKVDDRAHREAGDRRTHVGRKTVWTMNLAECLAKVPALSTSRDGLLDELAGVQAEIRAMDAVYDEAPWQRFFPSITKSHPHIHARLTCQTLHHDTVMSWAPQMSGRTEAEAVADLDEALCSVCFPSAPVALHNYTSKRSQAERAQREAERAEREARKAAKTLTKAEQFRTAYGSDLVTTVAACKELVRRAVEQTVELEWYNTPEAAAKWQGDADSLIRLRFNMYQHLGQMISDASMAATILMLRETKHEGWGATEADIAKIRASKERSARKEWGL